MPTPPLVPVRRKKLYENIVEQFEEMIFSGQLKPGDLLPSERELTEHFQVGRTSVREALFALQRMGLVSVRNGERATVTRPSAERLATDLAGTARHILMDPDGEREFQSARMLMECALARDAARKATPGDIENLARHLKANEQAQDNPHMFAETDVDFHLALTRVTRNSLFEAMYSAVSDWLSEQRLISLREPGSIEAAFLSHARIFEAIKARDPDLAEQEMGDHLRSVQNYYWSSRESQ